MYTKFARLYKPLMVELKCVQLGLQNIKSGKNEKITRSISNDFLPRLRFPFFPWEFK